MDDSSTDKTWRILQKMQAQTNDLIILRNTTNLGPGQSTLAALNHNLVNQSKYVKTVDGDGQFVGEEMFDFSQRLIFRILFMDKDNV